MSEQKIYNDNYINNDTNILDDYEKVENNLNYINIIQNNEKNINRDSCVKFEINDSEEQINKEYFDNSSN